jgi:FKBP-type peptidyl-prolyl cis-trans isomerase FkpA
VADGPGKDTSVKRLALLLAVAPVALMAACGSDTNPTSPSQQLVVQDIVVGTGATAAVGNTVSVKYVGTFTDGSTFDSGQFSFVLGAGQVIAGFDQGVVGMKVGGQRKLTVPPSLGYPNGQGSIPPNTTLIFVVDLLSVS